MSMDITYIPCQSATNSKLTEIQMDNKNKLLQSKKR